MNPMLMALLGQAALASPIDDAFGQAKEREAARNRLLGIEPATTPPPPLSLGEAGVEAYDTGQGPGGLAGSPEYQAWDAARKTSGAEGALQGQMPSRMMEMINRLMMQYRDR